MGPPGAPVRTRRYAVLLATAACFFASGFSGIVYEVMWVRLFGLTLGGTNLALSTVLTAFFLGMAGGSFASARRALRIHSPLRAYATLEAVIAVSAPLVTLGIARAHLVLEPLLGALGLEGAEYRAGAGMVAALLLMSLPTLAMGATLPLLGRFVVRTDSGVGAAAGWLYGINTAGAVLGAWGAGFWLLPRLGVAHTVHAAAALNLLVAFVASLLSRIKGGREAEGTDLTTAAAADPAASTGPGIGFELSPRLVLAIFAAHGFTSVLYEIAFTRRLVPIVGGTVYGFSTMLGTFLLGLALGGAAGGTFFAKLRRPGQALGWVELCLGLSVLWTCFALEQAPLWALRLGASLQGSLDPLSARALLSAASMLPPTLLFGASFPLVVRLLARRAEDAGPTMGRAYFANTLAGIAGSLITAHLAIPCLGISNSILAAIGVHLACAALVFAQASTEGGETARRPRALRLGLVAAAVLLAATSVPRGNPELGISGVYVNPGRLAAESTSQLQDLLRRQNGQVLFYREGDGSTVTVHDVQGILCLKHDGLNEAQMLTTGLQPVNSGEVLLGILPYLFAARPERALVVGLGGGITVDALAQTAIPEIEVVELERAVVEALPFLYPGRQAPTSDPRVHVTLGDGRNHLLHGACGSGKGYDLIASQPSHPWLSGVANLFTREYFQLARANLREGGAFCQWLNLFTMDTQCLRSVVAAFHEAFPSACGFQVGTGALLLVGRSEPGALDGSTAAARLADEKLGRVLSAIGYPRAVDLLGCLVLDPAAAARISSGVDANTDDNAFVETHLPGLVYSWTDSSRELVRWLGELGVHPLSCVAGMEAVATDLELLEKLVDRLELPRAKTLLALPFPGRDAATRQFLEARIAWKELEHARAAELLRALLAAEPGHAAARRTLALVLSEAGKFDEAVRALEPDPGQDILAGWTATRAGLWDHPVFQRLKARLAEGQARQEPVDVELARTLAAYGTRPGATTEEIAGALNLAKACLLARPQSEELHYLAGLAAWQAGAFGDAQRYWNRASALALLRAGGLYAKGVLALNAGEYDRAGDQFERAIRAFPPDWRFHEALFRALRLAGQHERALAALNRYIEESPEKGAARRQAQALLGQAGLTKYLPQLK